ncbi:MAG: acyl-CoA dehydrogenase family protein, partial [Chloroflexi bacterium]|nr:acyl-CoA dehydrogenase family protein [Chloroflexota bacterium]
MPATSHRDYSLTPAQRTLRADVARFSDQAIRPQARAIDEGNYPSDVLKNLSEAGFTQAGFPKDLGGTELDSVSWALI